MTAAGAMQASSARDVLESAHEAACERARIDRQIAAMDSAADGLGRGGGGPRVSSTPDHASGEARIVAMMDHRDRLVARRGECAMATAAASELLYGRDGRGGMWALVGWRADALFQHFVAAMPWEDVADVMGYSTEHVKREAAAAMEVADAWGLASASMGVGGACD